MEFVENRWNDIDEKYNWTIKSFSTVILNTFIVVLNGMRGLEETAIILDYLIRHLYNRVNANKPMKKLCFIKKNVLIWNFNRNVNQFACKLEQLVWDHPDQFKDKAE